MTKTEKIYWNSIVEDIIPTDSEIVLKVTGLTPGEIYYVDRWFDGERIQSAYIPLVQFTADNEGNGTVSFPIKNKIFEFGDVIHDFKLDVNYSVGDESISVERPYTVEYVSCQNIGDMVEQHESLINDINTALDNVIAKYELGGDVK